MSISVKLIFQFYTELELLKVAAGTIDPTPTLLGLTKSSDLKLQLHYSLSFLDFTLLDDPLIPFFG